MPSKRMPSKSDNYLGLFSSHKDIEHAFDVVLDDDITIIVAHYEVESYEGSAFVCYIKNGALFEVNGSH